MSDTGAAAYPSSPWRLHGTMWVSLFALVRDATGADGLPRPRGVYGAAWVDYVEPSPLIYRELLVARPVRRGRAGLGVRITDIWVDSPASRAGGRALWAIPKDLADFPLAPSAGRGTGEWAARVGGRPTAAGRVEARGPTGPRLPVRFGCDQVALPETEGPRVTPVRGTACPRAVRTRWDLPAEGPLAWLRGARPLGSVLLEGFDLTFG